MALVVDVECEDGHTCGKGHDDDGQTVIYTYKDTGKYR